LLQYIYMVTHTTLLCDDDDW